MALLVNVKNCSFLTLKTSLACSSCRYLCIYKLPRLDSLPAFRMFGCLLWDVWEVVPSHHHARESQRWHCTSPYEEMVLGILQCRLLGQNPLRKKLFVICYSIFQLCFLLLWHFCCKYVKIRLKLCVLECSNVHLNGIIGECEELFLLNFENLTCMFLLQVFVYL